MEPFRRYVESIMGPWSRTIEQTQAIREKTLPMMERFQEQVRESLARLPELGLILRRLEDFSEGIQRTLDVALPNWRGLEVEEIEPALDFGAETGITTVWVPRGDIVRELLAARDDADRDRVLVEHETEILEDFHECLAAVTHGELREEADLCGKALAAHRAGHPEAAHALTASVLSGLVHEKFGYKHFSDARARFTEDDPNDVALSVVRLTALLQVFGRALHHTDYAPGPGFNRHATAHGHAGQYTQVNAIAAHMLLVGLLRELDFWFKREDDERNAT